MVLLKRKYPWVSYAITTATLTIIIYAGAFAQIEGISINGDGAPPDPSSMLDVKSITKGFLVPRMSSSDRLAISNPANSLLVFDETIGAYFYYNGGVWVEVGTATAIAANSNNISNNTNSINALNIAVANKWDLSGNSGTTAGTDFIGTTDATDLVIKTNGQEQVRVSSVGNMGVGTATPVSKLHVSKSTGYDQLQVEYPYTPTGTNDSNGNVGNITWDNEYLYIKTSNGWKRVHLNNIPSGNGGGNGP